MPPTFTERSTDVERDELIAHLADKLLAVREAREELTYAARFQGEPQLLRAAAAYRETRKAAEAEQDSIPNDILIGQLVWGYAIRVAREAQSQRVNGKLVRNGIIKPPPEART